MRNIFSKRILIKSDPVTIYEVFYSDEYREYFPSIYSRFGPDPVLKFEDEAQDENCDYIYHKTYISKNREFGGALSPTRYYGTRSFLSFHLKFEEDTENSWTYFTMELYHAGKMVPELQNHPDFRIVEWWDDLKYQNLIPMLEEGLKKLCENYDNHYEFMSKLPHNGS